MPILTNKQLDEQHMQWKLKKPLYARVVKILEDDPSWEESDLNVHMSFVDMLFEDGMKVSDLDYYEEVCLLETAWSYFLTGWTMCGLWHKEQD